MKLPRELEAVTVVAKRNVFINEPHDITHERAFVEGVGWLHEHLSQGQEFDENLASKTFLNDPTGELTDEESFIRGARWQFEQMKARVGLAEAKYGVDTHFQRHMDLSKQLTAAREREGNLVSAARMRQEHDEDCGDKNDITLGPNDDCECGAFALKQALAEHEKGRE